jgi:hypothetical protein
MEILDFGFWIKIKKGSKPLHVWRRQLLPSRQKNIDRA